MNGVNLNAFQYDFDLTWMAFFQDGNGKTYARYGGREDDGPESHLTKASLVKTMSAVKRLHARKDVKPWSAYELQPKSTFTPEQLSPMKKMMAKRKEKCIHCHDVKHAMLRELEAANQLSKYKVFGYPSPRRLGIVLNPDEQQRVADVIMGSVAATAGIKAGDTVTSVDGQRVLTYADFTRVMELAPERGSVAVKVLRAGGSKEFDLPLSPGWRTSPDPSWRSSTHIVGPNTGFWGKEMSWGDLKNRGLTNEDLALKVVVVWGAWAKKAGVRNGDIVVELDGIKTKKTIRQLQTHLQMNHDFGDLVELTVLRNGKRQKITMNLPEHSED